MSNKRVPVKFINKKEKVYMSQVIGLNEHICNLEHQDYRVVLDKGMYLDVYNNEYGVDSKVSKGYSNYIYIDEEIPLGEFIENIEGKHKVYSVEKGTMEISNIPVDNDLYQDERAMCIPYSIRDTNYRIDLRDPNLNNTKVIESEIDLEYEGISGSENGILYEDSLQQLFVDNGIKEDYSDENILYQNGKRFAIKAFYSSESLNNPELHYDFRTIVEII